MSIAPIDAGRPVTTLRRPPDEPMGDRITVTVEVAINDRRHRETEDVVEIVGRWARRWVERKFRVMGYRCEGSSTDMRPGQTYFGWWFGSSEVYLYRSRP